MIPSQTQAGSPRRILKSMSWDLWIDYHRRDADGLTHAHRDDAEPGIELKPGAFIVVGNEEADYAAAEVVSIAPDGVVLVRVLPGPLDNHRKLLKRADAR